MENPYAGQQVEDFDRSIAASEEIGGKVLVETLGSYEVQSYGKVGIAGLAGEQGPANALLTTTFANPLREAVGGGEGLDFLVHEAGRARRSDRRSAGMEGRVVRSVAFSMA